MVAIENVKMPELCDQCPCSSDRFEWCNSIGSTGRYVYEYYERLIKPDWCPLEELRGPFGSYAEVVKDAYYNNRHTNPEDRYRREKQ